MSTRKRGLSEQEQKILDNLFDFNDNGDSTEPTIKVKRQRTELKLKIPSSRPASLMKSTTRANQQTTPRSAASTPLSASLSRTVPPALLSKYLRLPVIIDTIYSFLDSRFVFNTCTRVCKAWNTARWCTSHVLINAPKSAAGVKRMVSSLKRIETLKIMNASNKCVLDSALSTLFRTKSTAGRQQRYLLEDLQRFELKNCARATKSLKLSSFQKLSKVVFSAVQDLTPSFLESLLFHCRFTLQHLEISSCSTLTTLPLLVRGISEQQQQQQQQQQQHALQTLIVSDCSKLNRFTLSQTDFENENRDDDSLVWCSVCPSLLSLTISSCALLPVEVINALFEQCTQLQDLRLRKHPSLHSVCIISSTLQRLVVEECPLFSRSLTLQCSALQTFKCTDPCVWTMQALDAVLAENDALRSLSISAITDETIGAKSRRYSRQPSWHLLSSASLQQLTIESIPSSITELSGLNFRALQSLTLSQVSASEMALDLSDCQLLSHLRLESFVTWKIEVAHAPKHLKLNLECKFLKELSYESCDWISGDLHTLFSSTTTKFLKSLVLRYCPNVEHIRLPKLVGGEAPQLMIESLKLVELPRVTSVAVYSPSLSSVTIMHCPLLNDIRLESNMKLSWSNLIACNIGPDCKVTFV